MGTELIRVHVKEENDDIPSVPPGFESFAAYTLKRVQDGEKQESNVTSCSATTSASESQSVKMDTEFEDEAKVTRSLRRRPWIKFEHLDSCSEDESDSVKLNQVSFSYHFHRYLFENDEQHHAYLAFEFLFSLASPLCLLWMPYIPFPYSRISP